MDYRMAVAPVSRAESCCLVCTMSQHAQPIAANEAVVLHSGFALAELADRWVALRWGRAERLEATQLRYSIRCNVQNAWFDARCFGQRDTW